MGCQGSHLVFDKIPAEVQQKDYTREDVVFLFEQEKYEAVERVADVLFKEGCYEEAIQIYQKVIENNLNQDYDAQGLGNFEQLSGLVTDQSIYNYYEQCTNQNRIKKNPYDGLSLCFAAIRGKNQEVIESGLQWYENLIQMVENYQIYIGLANLLSNCDRFDEALAKYQKVITLKPALLSSYVSIAFIRQFYRKDKPALQQALKKINELDPNNIYAQYLVTKNLSLQVRLIKLEYLKDKYPKYVRIANEIGLFYREKRQSANAAVYYKKSIQDLPKYVTAYYNYGFSLEKQKQNKDSVHYYFKACELDMHFAQAYRQLVYVFIELKLTDEEIKLQVSKYPKVDLFEFYYRIGVAYYEFKLLKQCLKWYQSALNLKQDARVYNSLAVANCYFPSTEQINRELHCFSKSIEMDPKQCLPYYNRGIFHKKYFRTDKAISDYRKAIELNPRFTEAYNNLGNIYKQKQEYPNAIKCFKKAIECNSSFTLAYTNLMICEQKFCGEHKALQTYSLVRERFRFDCIRMPQSTKTYIKKNLDRCGLKWKERSSMQHSSSDPALFMKHSHLLNEDDHGYINYQQRAYSSLHEVKYNQ